MARRYLVKDLRRAGASVTLPREVAHHVSRVMRMRAGDRVTLFDGAGFEASGELVQTKGSAKAFEVALESAPEASAREPSVAVELAFGVPKGTRADWLFEHACEVGVRRFRPLLTARTEQFDKPDAIPRKLARWRRIIEAAAGQCDRAWLPAVEEPSTLERLLDHTDNLPQRRFVASAEAAEGHPPPAALGPAPANTTALLMVGPEGGLTPEELAGCDAAQFTRVSLGLLTLRAETAALVGVARLLA